MAAIYMLGNTDMSSAIPASPCTVFHPRSLCARFFCFSTFFKMSSGHTSSWNAIFPRPAPISGLVVLVIVFGVCCCAEVSAEVSAAVAPRSRLPALPVCTRGLPGSAWLLIWMDEDAYLVVRGHMYRGLYMPALHWGRLDSWRDKVAAALVHFPLSSLHCRSAFPTMRLSVDG